MAKILIIYNEQSMDGFAAAWAMLKALGPKAEFYPSGHGATPPDVTGRDVFVLALGYDLATLQTMAASARAVIVLNYHKTVEADLAGLTDPGHRSFEDLAALAKTNGTPALYGRFDTTHSTAYLAWAHFFGNGDVPELIRYVEDIMLWKKSMPNVDEVKAALRSYPQDFDIWNGFKVPELIREGRSILRFYRQAIESVKTTAGRTTIGGYDVPIVNAPFFLASDIANELAEGETFAAAYYFDHSIGQHRFSLRSRGTFDVGAFAASLFGGGGSPVASGFRIASLSDLNPAAAAPAPAPTVVTAEPAPEPAPAPQLVDQTEPAQQVAVETADPAPAGDQATPPAPAEPETETETPPPAPAPEAVQPEEEAEAPADQGQADAPAAPAAASGDQSEVTEDQPAAVQAEDGSAEPAAQPSESLVDKLVAEAKAVEAKIEQALHGTSNAIDENGTLTNQPTPPAQ